MFPMRGLNYGRQARIGLCTSAGCSALPRVKSTARYAQRTTKRSHWVGRLLRLDPGVPRAGALAKYASAFFRTSSSCSARAKARRNRINSACSSERRPEPGNASTSPWTAPHSTDR